MPRKGARDLESALGFVTRVRLDHLRLAAHIYQSPEPMDATVAAIAEEIPLR